MTTTDSRLTPLSAGAVPAQEATRAPHEQRFVAIIILLVLLLTSAPFVFAYTTAPADRHFMGVMVNIPDHNQYFAWMRDLARDNLAPNRLTAEANDPAFFNLLWWSVGRFGALTGLDYAALFGILRIVALLSCLGCGYLFLRLVVPDLRQRWLAFGLFAFSGGMGVIWIFIKYFVPQINSDGTHFDIFTAEHNTFFIMLAFPHFAMALALIVAIMGLMLLALQRQQLRYAVAAGLVGMVLGLQHAYDLITIYAVFGLFGLLIWWRDRRFPTFLFKCGVILAVLSVPPVLYLANMVLTDAAWGQKLDQFDNASAWTPGPLHLPILLGVPLLLALVAFRPRMLQSRNDHELFIATWFIAHFVLIYLPVKFQIHLLLGWQIPIVILASAALLKHIGPALARRWGRLAWPIVVGLLGLCVITNVYLLTWRFIDLSRYAAPYYLSQNEVAALRWLDTNATRDDVVLSVLDFGQFVPVWSDARAFLAHWAGTLDFYGKQQMVAIMLNSQSSAAERQAILQEFGVSYVVVREQDRPAAQFTPEVAPYLVPVFQQGDVTIYQTQLNALR